MFHVLQVQMAGRCLTEAAHLMIFPLIDAMSGQFISQSQKGNYTAGMYLMRIKGDYQVLKPILQVSYHLNARQTCLSHVSVI